MRKLNNKEQKLFLEIENYILNELKFSKNEDNIYTLNQQRVVGEMIINNQVQQQVQNVNIKLEFLSEYFIEDISEISNNDFYGLAYQITTNSENKSPIIFVKTLNDFKEMFGIKK